MVFSPLRVSSTTRNFSFGEIWRFVLQMAAASHVFGLNHDRIMFQAEAVAHQFMSRIWNAIALGIEITRKEVAA